LNGFETAIKIRRILVGALYDKVINLSVKGMTETNSGKLISLISADLFQVERGLSFAPVVIAAPIVNIVAYVVLSFTIGWKYTFVALGFWILLLCMQYCSSKWARSC
jgi:ABC-type multidrug transport system fused ATPase/permease subunit